MELASVSGSLSAPIPFTLLHSYLASRSFSSSFAANGSLMPKKTSTFAIKCAGGSARLKGARLQQFPTAAFVGDSTVIANDSTNKDTSARESTPTPNHGPDEENDNENDIKNPRYEKKMIQVCDKLIHVFLIDKPTPADWRKLLVFSKEWSNIGPYFYKRCYERAENESDPALKHQMLRLGRKLKEIDADISRHNELLNIVESSQSEINDIVARRRKDFTGEFFIHLHTVAESYYDNPAEQNAMVELSKKCLSAVQAYDSANESMDALTAAQLKFEDILKSPSLDAACKKIDDLAQKNQLDPSLVLMMSKAWSAAKETDLVQDEAKDILFHLYMQARANLERVMPKEIRILKCILMLEDPEEQMSALKDAFTPGEELESEHIDLLYTTPEKLYNWIRIILDAYYNKVKGAHLKDAMDLMKPKVIPKMEELKNLIKDRFL